MTHTTSVSTTRKKRGEKEKSGLPSGELVPTVLAFVRSVPSVYNQGRAIEKKERKQVDQNPRRGEHIMKSNINVDLRLHESGEWCRRDGRGGVRKNEELTRAHMSRNMLRTGEGSLTYRTLVITSHLDRDMLQQ